MLVGCGVAGPAAAMALHKVGIEATIYEAHPGAADETGIFLTVATNGVDALRTLDAEETVTAAGFSTTAMVLWSGTGKRLGSAVVSTTRPDGTTGYTLKRADLYRGLRDLALSRGVRIEHGKQLTAAEDVGDRVVAHFADGTDYEADILVGCDGVRSTVRHVIDATAPVPKYVGLINLGGFVSGVEVPAEVGNYHMIFGARAFFGYALAPSGEVWWFANIPQRAEPGPGSLGDVSSEVWKARLLDLFAGDVGPARRLIEATSHELRASTVHTLAHLPKWHNERMIVIGDAAHAPSPSSGQGASLSVEDAVLLAKCLRDNPQPIQAFEVFTSLRRQRVERIIKQAARVNNSKAATGMSRVARDAVLPHVLKFIATSKQTRDLYDYHVEWDEMLEGI
jgi:2-polyprenyl-6-methoxyphenol hydroxylase-like FAD-dependent oxidoreductase